MNATWPTAPRRSGARPPSARLAGALVATALAAVLTSCGDGAADEKATDAAEASSSPVTPTPSETTSESPTDASSSAPADGPVPIEATGPAGVTQAMLVQATEGGGSASSMALALDTDRAVSEFVAGLQNGLAEKVSAVVGDVAAQAPAATPYGAVVSTGCDAPREVAIDAGEAGFQVVPRMPKNTVQCLAPVTYVVIFAAPDP